MWSPASSLSPVDQAWRQHAPDRSAWRAAPAARMHAPGACHVWPCTRTSRARRRARALPAVLPVTAATAHASRRRQARAAKGPPTHVPELPGGRTRRGRRGHTRACWRRGPPPRPCRRTPRPARSRPRRRLASRATRARRTPLPTAAQRRARHRAPPPDVTAGYQTFVLSISHIMALPCTASTSSLRVPRPPLPRGKRACMGRPCVR
jgi:hypothetical protein